MGAALREQNLGPAAVRSATQAGFAAEWAELGADHPQTLKSASNLATDLERLDQHQGAAELRAEVRHRRSGQDEAAPDNRP
jgi:hypothetical protein